MDKANRAQVQKALSLLCGTTAHLSCYTRDGWQYDPEEALAELKQAIELLTSTKPDGQFPWAGRKE